MADIKAALVPFQFEGRCNVSTTERWLTGIAGAALTAYGVSRAVQAVRHQRADREDMPVEDTGDTSDSTGALSAQLPGTSETAMPSAGTAGDLSGAVRSAKADAESRGARVAGPAGEAPSVPADLSEQERARKEPGPIEGPSARTAGLIMLAGGALVARAASGFCPMYAMLGRGSDDANWEPRKDTAARRTLSGNRGFRVHEAITIDRPVRDVYAFWRNFENLPHFMSHVVSVRRMDDRRSHWEVRGPLGSSVEWDAEIVNEEPNKVIGWRTLTGADVVSAGSVSFDQAPGGGTRLDVRLQYQPPAGAIGATIAKLMEEDPGRAIREDLARLKSVLEARDIPKASGS